MLIPAIAFALVTVGQQPQAAATTDKKDATTAAPPLDRSAESALRDVFAAVGALRNVHIRAEFYNREYDAQRWDDDSSGDFWVGDGHRFRLKQSSNYWGGGKIVVCDGDALLTDNMDDDQPITISKAAKTLHEISDQEPMLYLLEGAPGFDELVVKDKPVVFKDSSAPNLKTIELNAKGIGRIQISYDNTSHLPVRVETMLPPWWDDDSNPYPGQPNSREDISIVGAGHIDSTLFAVTAPKGRKVDDQRAKK